MASAQNLTNQSSTKKRGAGWLGPAVACTLALACAREAEPPPEVATPEPAGGMRAVAVYFSNPGLDPDPAVDCEAVFPVSRSAPVGSAEHAAVAALLAGPTPAERAAGYASRIESGVRVRSLSIENGVATVDFSEELERTGGSCMVLAIRSQIVRTLEQFPSVNRVRISVEGRTEDILQP